MKTIRKLAAVAVVLSWIGCGDPASETARLFEETAVVGEMGSLSDFVAGSVLSPVGVQSMRSLERNSGRLLRALASGPFRVVLSHASAGAQLKITVVGPDGRRSSFGPTDARRIEHVVWGRASATPEPYEIVVSNEGSELLDRASLALQAVVPAPGHVTAPSAAYALPYLERYSGHALRARASGTFRVVVDQPARARLKVAVFDGDRLVGSFGPVRWRHLEQLVFGDLEQERDYEVIVSNEGGDPLPGGTLQLVPLTPAPGAVLKPVDGYPLPRLERHSGHLVRTRARGAFKVVVEQPGTAPLKVAVFGPEGLVGSFGPVRWQHLEHVIYAAGDPAAYEVIVSNGDGGQTLEHGTLTVVPIER